MKNRSHIQKNLVFMVIGISLLTVSVFIPIPIYATSFNTTLPTVVSPEYEIQILVPGGYFHGIHGLTFDSQDNIYIGSIVGQSIYKVNPKTGQVQVNVGPPFGMADDMEFGPDGRLYWTTMPMGRILCKSADAKIEVLAEELPGTNAIAFNQEGRLFITQVFMGDALWEIDLSGGKANRKVAENLGGLNGFDFGPDGKIYGPLWFKKVIGRVDPETGQVDIVAKGFQQPAAANFDSKGNLYVVDMLAGEVIRVDIQTGQKTLIAKVEPSIDNLAIDSKDRVFISNMANNAIYEIDTKTGKSRTVVEGKLASPQGVAVVTEADGDVLHVADIFSYRKVDGVSGEITTVARSCHAVGPKIIDYPNGISVHKNSVVLTSLFFGSVQELDRLSGTSKRVLHGFKAPTHAMMIDDGSLIVAEMGTGNLLKVTGEKEQDRKIIATGLAAPTWLAPAGSGAVYVAEFMTGTISRIDLGSGEKKVVASGLNGPEGFAAKPDGKFVVVEEKTRQLVEIDPASGARKSLVVNLEIGSPAFPGGAPFGNIASVAVSDSGTIYLTADINNAIYKITPK